MNLHELKPAKGSLLNGKRLGRGQGSGKGGTSTRGHKGAKSRSGHVSKVGFEGGQMPLQRRIPKFGFKNINRIKYRCINIDVINLLVENNKVFGELDKKTFIKNKLISKNDKIKILGRGKLNYPLVISAHKFTKNAIALIKNSGGSVVKL